MSGNMYKINLSTFQMLYVLSFPLIFSTISEGITDENHAFDS